MLKVWVVMIVLAIIIGTVADPVAWPYMPIPDKPVKRAANDTLKP